MSKADLCRSLNIYKLIGDEILRSIEFTENFSNTFGYVLDGGYVITVRQFFELWCAWFIIIIWFCILFRCIQKLIDVT